MEAKGIVVYNPKHVVKALKGNIDIINYVSAVIPMMLAKG